MKKLQMGKVNKKVAGVILFGLIVIAVLIAYALNTLLPVQVSGMFGFPGESTGVPTTVVLLRTGEYRILVASSGRYGEVVEQAARWSSMTRTGLQVVDMNSDSYDDLSVDNLVLYGSPSGLSVWEPEQ